MDMETEQKFYVYVDFREDDGRPFYVGKGSRARVKLEKKRNPLHTNIKNKHGMVRKILFETYSEQEAFQKEVELIQELKTHIDFGEGGANFTLGGDGTTGYKWNEEQREEQREACKKKWENPEYREKFSEARKKLWENPEYREKIREKISEASKRMWKDSEYKKFKSESSKKLWENPEYREKTSEAIKKAWEDPDLKEKISEAIKQHHSDPEFRKKLGEKIREALSDPEIREKISRTTKEKLSDPEIRKKIKLGISKLTPEQRSERIRKGWETRRLQKLQQES